MYFIRLSLTLANILLAMHCCCWSVHCEVAQVQEGYTHYNSTVKSVCSGGSRIFQTGGSKILLLPSATVVAGRYCFHRCLFVHGGSPFWGVGLPGPRPLLGVGMPGPRSLLGVGMSGTPGKYTPMGMYNTKYLTLSTKQ